MKHKTGTLEILSLLMSLSSLVLFDLKDQGSPLLSQTMSWVASCSVKTKLPLPDIPHLANCIQLHLFLRVSELESPGLALSDLPAGKAN